MPAKRIPLLTGFVLFCMVALAAEAQDTYDIGKGLVEGQKTIHSIAVNPETGDVLITYTNMVPSSGAQTTYLVSGRQKGNGTYAFKKPQVLDAASSRGEAADLLWLPDKGRFLLILEDAQASSTRLLTELNRKGKPVGSSVNLKTSLRATGQAATLLRDKDGKTTDLLLALENNTDALGPEKGIYLIWLDPDTYAVKKGPLFIRGLETKEDVNYRFIGPRSIDVNEKGLMLILARRQLAPLESPTEFQSTWAYVVKANGKLKKAKELFNTTRDNLFGLWLSKKEAILTGFSNNGGIYYDVTKVKKNLKEKDRPGDPDYPPFGFVSFVRSAPGGPVLEIENRHGDMVVVYQLDDKGERIAELFSEVTDEFSSTAFGEDRPSALITKDNSILWVFCPWISSSHEEIRVMHMQLGQELPANGN